MTASLMHDFIQIAFIGFWMLIFLLMIIAGAFKDHESCQDLPSIEEMKAKNASKLRKVYEDEHEVRYELQKPQHNNKNKNK